MIDFDILMTIFGFRHFHGKLWSKLDQTLILRVGPVGFFGGGIATKPLPKLAQLGSEPKKCSCFEIVEVVPEGNICPILPI